MKPRLTSLMKSVLLFLLSMIFLLPGCGKEEALAKWVKHKASRTQEGWNYDMSIYRGSPPPEEDNFYMAEPFKGYLMSSSKGMEANYQHPLIREKTKTFLERAHIAAKTRRQSGEAKIMDWRQLARNIRDTSTSINDSELNKAIKGNDEEVIDHYFSYFNDFLMNLHKATDRPRSYFPTIKKDVHLRTLLPHLGPMKKTVNFLRDASAFKLRKGDRQGAMKDIQLMFALYRICKEDTWLISQLVRVAMGITIVDTYEETHAKGLWSTEELNQWKAFFKNQRNGYGELTRALRVERLSTLEVFELFLADKPLFDRIATEEGSEGFAGILKFKDMARDTVVEQMIAYDRLMQELITMVDPENHQGHLNQTTVDFYFENQIPGPGKLSIAGTFIATHKTALNAEKKLMEQFDSAYRK